MGVFHCHILPCSKPECHQWPVQTKILWRNCPATPHHRPVSIFQVVPRSVRFAKPADINLGTIRNRSLRGSEKSHKQNGLSRKRFHNRSRTSARKSLRPGTLAYSNLPFHVFHESVEGEATARNIQISIIPSCCSLMSQLEDPANHKVGSVFRKLM